MTNPPYQTPYFDVASSPTRRVTYPQLQDPKQDELNHLRNEIARLEAEERLRPNHPIQSGASQQRAANDGFQPSTFDVRSGRVVEEQPRVSNFRQQPQNYYPLENQEVSPVRKIQPQYRVPEQKYVPYGDVSPTRRYTEAPQQTQTYIPAEAPRRYTVPAEVPTRRYVEPTQPAAQDPFQPNYNEDPFQVPPVNANEVPSHRTPTTTSPIQDFIQALKNSADNECDTVQFEDLSKNLSSLSPEWEQQFSHNSPLVKRLMSQPFTEDNLEVDFLAVAALGFLEVEDTNNNKVEALEDVIIPQKNKNCIDSEDDRFAQFWGRLLRVAIPLPDQQDDEMFEQMVETTAKELCNSWLDVIFGNNQQLPVDQWKSNIVDTGSAIFEQEKLVENVYIEPTWPLCDGTKAQKRKKFLDAAQEVFPENSPEQNERLATEQSPYYQSLLEGEKSFKDESSPLRPQANRRRTPIPNAFETQQEVSNVNKSQKLDILKSYFKNEGPTINDDSIKNSAEQKADKQKNSRIEQALKNRDSQKDKTVLVNIPLDKKENVNKKKVKEQKDLSNDAEVDNSENTNFNPIKEQPNNTLDISRQQPSMVSDLSHKPVSPLRPSKRARKHAPQKQPEPQQDKKEDENPIDNGERATPSRDASSPLRAKRGKKATRQTSDDQPSETPAISDTATQEEDPQASSQYESEVQQPQVVEQQQPYEPEFGSGLPRRQYRQPVYQQPVPQTYAPPQRYEYPQRVDIPPFSGQRPAYNAANTYNGQAVRQESDSPVRRVYRNPTQTTPNAPPTSYQPYQPEEPAFGKGPSNYRPQQFGSANDSAYSFSPERQQRSMAPSVPQQTIPSSVPGKFYVQ